MLFQSPHLIPDRGEYWRHKNTLMVAIYLYLTLIRLYLITELNDDQCLWFCFACLHSHGIIKAWWKDARLLILNTLYGGRTKVWPPLKKRGSDMKERNRAIRRHHSERLKTKRSRFSAAGNCFLGDITTVSKGMTYHTPCRCSCWMCGNQRKFHGMNAQEKRARALFTD